MRVPLVAGALLLAACSKNAGAPDIQISDAWARETVAGQTGTAAYMTIANRGTGNDRLVSIAAEPPARAMLHETSNEGGIARMRNLARGLEIPAGKAIPLKPNAPHAMLMDLPAPLKAGDELELNLRFEKSGERRVTVRIVGAAER